MKDLLFFNMFFSEPQIEHLELYSKIIFEKKKYNYDDVFILKFLVYKIMQYKEISYNDGDFQKYFHKDTIISFIISEELNLIFVRLNNEYIVFNDKEIFNLSNDTELRTFFVKYIDFPLEINKLIKPFTIQSQDLNTYFIKNSNVPYLFRESKNEIVDGSYVLIDFQTFMRNFYHGKIFICSSDVFESEIPNHYLCPLTIEFFDRFITGEFKKDEIQSIEVSPIKIKNGVKLKLRALIFNNGEIFKFRLNNIKYERIKYLEKNFSYISCVKMELFEILKFIWISDKSPKFNHELRGRIMKTYDERLLTQTLIELN